MDNLQLTRQNDFNVVIMAMMRQKVKAIENTVCRYLDNKGNRCAIGHLLTDSDLTQIGTRLYGSPSIEVVLNGIHHYKGSTFDKMRKDRSFYIDLQARLHDCVPDRFIPQFVKFATYFASDWNLELPREITESEYYAE